MRNILGSCSLKYRKEVAEQVKLIFQSADMHEARRRLNDFIDEFEKKTPKAVKFCSVPIMSELHAYLSEQQQHFEPNGVAGKAISSILKRFTELSQFLRHLEVPLDNNLTERALKLVIQTRKSSMFYKTLKSAKFASYVQTAIYSAAQNDVNPYDYMKAIIDNKALVLKNPELWLPWNYKAEEATAFQEDCISPA